LNESNEQRATREPTLLRKFVLLQVLVKQQREEQAERVKQGSLNKDATVTQEDEDAPSEGSLSLHRRDPDLCNRQQHNQGLLAELTLETDILFAPLPIESDPVMRPGYQCGGSCSSPCRSPRRKPKPKLVTDPKVNLSTIPQCEGISKEEANQFSSSMDPDDDQDSNFDAFMDPVDTAPDGDGGEETNKNKEEAENAGEEGGPADGGHESAGSEGSTDDAAGKASGDGDSTDRLQSALWPSSLH